MPDATGTLEKLAYQESTRAIAQQQVVLDEMRARAATVFGMGSVAVAFLAGQTLRGGDIPWGAYVAALLYLGSLTAALVILWPRDKFKFSNSAAGMLVPAWRLDDDEIHAHLAKNLEEHWDHNYKIIRPLFGLLAACVALVGASVACWLAVLFFR